MQDLAYVLGTVVFVVIGALFIAGCDRIIGPDDEALLEDLPAGEPPADEREVARVSDDAAVGLVIVVLIAAFLVYTLLAPEKL